MILLLAALASATPVTLNWQGRLLDGDGIPLNGDRDVELVLYQDSVTSTPFHTETVDPAPVDDGFVAIRLGADPANLLQSESLMGGTWVQVRVDDADLGVRTELVSTPYAAVASQLDGTARLADTTAACSGSTLGTLRFHNDTFEGCTSGGWKSLITADSSGNVDIGGSLTVMGNTDLGGTLEVISNTDLGGTLEVVGDADVGGELDVTGNTNVGAALDVTGLANIGGALDVTGRADIGGDVDIVGEQSDSRYFIENYSVSTANTAPLLPSMPTPWSGVVTCSVTGTGASGTSMWLLKLSNTTTFLERVASINSTASNTPEIYASGSTYRLRLFNHANNYNVRCQFQEII